MRQGRSTIDEIMQDGRLVDLALRRAAREALIRHKRAGVPISVWEDGKVVEIPPAEIRIPGEPRIVRAGTRPKRTRRPR